TEDREGRRSRITRSSFSLERLLRLITVSEGLQKRHDLVFLLIGQPEVPDRRIHILWELRGGPAHHLFSLRAIRASGKFIAGVVEADDFFQALKVTIVHIGLNEMGTGPLFPFPQGGDLKLAIELRREPRPIGIRVEERISKKVAYSFVHIRR